MRLHRLRIIATTVLLVLGLVASAQAGPRMYEAILSIHFAGNDTVSGTTVTWPPDTLAG